MSFFMRLVNGRLIEGSERDHTYPDDVLLVQRPTGDGPWTYDAVNQLAVAVTDLTPDLRAAAVALLTDANAQMKAMRALVLLMRDEINILRQRDVDRAADIAAFTGAAAAAAITDLKAKWAARSALTERSIAQVKGVWPNKINTPDADK